jgi:alpha-glucosidase (family GH31 glycosyl hydrolase)
MGITFSFFLCSCRQPFIVIETQKELAIITKNYQLRISKSPVLFRTFRQGKVILRSTKSDIDTAEFAPGAFLATEEGNWSHITSFEGWSRPSRDRVVLNFLTDGHPELLHYEIIPHENYYTIIIDTSDVSVKEIGDTYELNASGHWYGQGEIGHPFASIPPLNKPAQYHPLETGEIVRRPFKSDAFNSVVCPFWLASNGVGIFVDTYDYLSQMFNSEENGLFSLKMMEHSTLRPQNTRFSYNVIVGDVIVDVYRTWLLNDWPLKRAWDPEAPLPPFEMFSGPIWTTWAQYKHNISQAKVEELAQQIIDNGFPYSILEIDDKWTPKWGDLVFDEIRFSDPGSMVESLHQNGFKVSLWVPPFVILSAENFKEGAGIDPPRQNNYFLTTPQPNPLLNDSFLIPWWDTLYILPLSGAVDFSDVSAGIWWQEKLISLQDLYGIDGFKFDAGEAIYFPDTAVSDLGIHPNEHADYYAWWSRSASAYELRAAWFSQDLAPIVRQFDKNSTWDLSAGLHSVVTQMLAMGMIGYPYVLPDMIGGNEYLIRPSSELLIRWTQLTAFLPMMQFSILPWRTEDPFTPETLEITREFAWIHQDLVDEIWDLVLETQQTGMPIVRPLFFEYPEDQKTYPINDQFFLGPDILVAPVVYDGMRSRDVYLPAGAWLDFWTDEELSGPALLEEYPAPIERIPVFRRKAE